MINWKIIDRKIQESLRQKVGTWSELKGHASTFNIQFIKYLCYSNVSKLLSDCLSVYLSVNQL